MKFRYYITDPFDGMVKGTDKDDVAAQFAMADDYVVVDSETGAMLISNESIDVKDVELVGI